MKISIVTVSYNSATTIADTLRSVACQSYGNIEHLIIDGQSIDETMEIVAEHSHPKLVSISERDLGIYDAMNKGVQRATGDVIGILNSDDSYLDSNVLQAVATEFSSNPALEVLLGDVDFVNASNQNNPIRTYQAGRFKTWMFRFGFMPPHPGVFVRRSAYERVGLYNVGYKIAGDFDFLVRLLLIDRANYYATGKHWVRMLVGGRSTASWRSNFMITKEMYRSLLDNKVFTCIPMLLVRLPVKFIRQVLL